MSKTTKEKILKRVSFKKTKIFLVLTLIAFFSLLPIIISLAQEKDKIIEHKLSGEPIKVTSFKVENKSIKSNEKFSAADDWLKSLTVEIENTSGKTIRHISIGLHILRPKEQENIPPLHFALERGLRDKALKGEDSAFVLKSDSGNNLTSISVSPGEYKNIRGSLDELKYPDKIERVQVQIEELIFDDGTAWAFGSWFKIKDGKLILDKEATSSANNGAAFLFEGCSGISPDEVWCANEGTNICYLRIYDPNGSGNQRFTPRYESCYTRNRNGGRGDRCNAQNLINLPVVCETPSPTPTPPPVETDWCGEVPPGGRDWYCQINHGWTYRWDIYQCKCVNDDPWESPIVIDVLGNGFNLTNAANGVRFDINRDGIKEQLAWTSANSDDAWLVLDRNENGTIDSGKELFGNNSPQPVPPLGEERNGFLALAVFDKPLRGGNNDGRISPQDAVFEQLRLWQDTNHNGISEASELHTLDELELRKIDLDYQQSNRVDQFGNQFKYRARVRDANDAQLGRWAWDVFLITAR